MAKSNSTLVSFYTSAYFFPGIQFNSGFSVGAGNPLVTKLTVDQDGDVTTSSFITCLGNLTAPNIYTNTEVYNPLTPKKQIWRMLMPN